MLAFLLFCFVLGLVLILLPNYFIPQNNYNNLEKFSVFECGFNPFQETWSTFDVKFYLVGILFIIFDFEITFLIPWALCLGELTVNEFFLMLIFIIILLVGFFYEWKIGALDW